jgi:hypothetical protein
MAGVGLWRGNFRCRGETREFLHNTPRPVNGAVAPGCSPPPLGQNVGESHASAGAASRWLRGRAT